MRLVKFVIDGYKRFSTSQTLRLDEKVVAVVGPNEGGKTSILKALTHVGTSRKFSTAEKDRELSRVRSFADDHDVLTAVFALDPDDVTHLLEQTGATGVSGLRFVKRADGSSAWNLAPDSRLLTSQVARDDKADLHSLVRQSDAAEPHSSHNVTLLSATRAAVESPEPCTAAALHELESQWQRASKGAGDTSASAIADLLVSIRKQYAAVEKQEAEILSVLKARAPVFREFTEDDRDLRSTYAILDKTQKTTKPFPDGNRALDSLLMASGQDRDALVDAVQSNYDGPVTAWVERANDQLTAVLNNGWSQSNIRMRLRVDGRRLAILAGPANDLSPVEDHSAGMRVFIALACFLAREQTDDRGVVVLIDEAEQHLHYDAQADLVVRLTDQEYARQVIYTTHSAGCLPENLGASIRAVEPDGDSSSLIRNNIWHHGRPGVMTLHYALGASTFARSAGRRAVFTEGVSDCTLLPRFLREVTDDRVLGFQVVPGLSDVAADEVEEITLGSRLVAFVLDGDLAGREREEWLLRHGAQPERIFRLPDDHVIEDLVAHTAYVAAVSVALNLEGDPGELESVLAATNRPRALKGYCESRGLTVPGKRLIATSMLLSADANATGGLLDPRFRSDMRDLLGKLKRVLSL